MRIALLSAEYPPLPGGIGDYTSRLAGALLQRGHDLFVLTGRAFRDRETHLSPALSDPWPLIELPIDVWNWGCWRAVIAAVDRLRPDLLHIQYQTGAYGMHPAINLLPWRLRSLPARPKVLVTAHDILEPYLFPKAGRLRRWVTRRLLDDADGAVMTNLEDYAQICAWRRRAAHPDHRTFLIPIGSNIPVAPPEGYDRAVWRAQLGLEHTEIVIAYFGLVSQSKGLSTLLDALVCLPLAVRLLVVGGAATAPADLAYAKEVQAQLDRLGLRQRAIFSGHCSASEVSAHLLAADLAVLPFTDGASLRRGSLLAVLAHGLPTVTTMKPPDNHNVPWAAQSALPTLRDEENALLVPPGDTVALVEAIERLRTDTALRAHLSSAARAFAAQFSWETISAQHESVYRELLDLNLSSA